MWTPGLRRLRHLNVRQRDVIARSDHDDELVPERVPHDGRRTIQPDAQTHKKFRNFLGARAFTLVTCGVTGSCGSLAVTCSAAVIDASWQTGFFYLAVDNYGNTITSTLPAAGASSWSLQPVGLIRPPQCREPPMA